MGFIRPVIVFVRQSVIHALDSTESAKGAALQSLVIVQVFQRCTIIDLRLCHRTEMHKFHIVRKLLLCSSSGSDRRR